MNQLADLFANTNVTFGKSATPAGYYTDFSKQGQQHMRIIGYIDIETLPENEQVATISFKSTKEWYEKNKFLVESLSHTLGNNTMYKFDRFEIINSKKEFYKETYGVYGEIYHKKLQEYIDEYPDVIDDDEIGRIFNNTEEKLYTTDENLIKKYTEEKVRNVMLDEWSFKLLIIVSDIDKNIDILAKLANSLKIKE